MKVSARDAYSYHIEQRTKHLERGYGEKVTYINQCPECNGNGYMDEHKCYCCDNQPDKPEQYIQVRGKWYERIIK